MANGVMFDFMERKFVPASTVDQADGTKQYVLTSATQILPAEAAILSGVTATAAELNLNHTASPGSVVNSKSVIYDAAGKIARSSATPAGFGTTVADATALTAELNYVTGANATVGVVLPVAAAGEVVEVINSVTTAGNYLKVYAITGSQINALGSTVAFQLNPGQKATFVGRSAVLWNTAVAADTITGLTATAAELNVLHSVVAGTASASSGAVLGASKNLDILGLPVSGLKIGAAGAEVVVTSTAAELNALTDVPVTLTVVSTTPASGSCAAQFAFKNGAGGALSHAVAGFGYISSVDGLADATVTTFATNTNGVILSVVTTNLFKFVTTATGLLGITINSAGAADHYITFINPNNGKLITTSTLHTNA